MGLLPIRPSGGRWASCLPYGHLVWPVVALVLAFVPPASAVSLKRFDPMENEGRMAEIEAKDLAASRGFVTIGTVPEGSRRALRVTLDAVRFEGPTFLSRRCALSGRVASLERPLRHRRGYVAPPAEIGETVELAFDCPFRARDLPGEPPVRSSGQTMCGETGRPLFARNVRVDYSALEAADRVTVLVWSEGEWRPTIGDLWIGEVDGPAGEKLDRVTETER